jgi:cell division protein FtsQ
MKKTFLKISLILILLPLLIGVPLWSLNDQGYFLLNKINFENQEVASADAYISTLMKSLDKKLEVFKGKSLFEVDLNEIVKIISSEKWIQSFEVQREWPNSLKVKIKNYELVMLYWNEKNEAFPIFSNNEMLDKINRKEIPDLIHVFDKKYASQKDLRKKTIEMIQKLPEQGPLSQKQIAEVGYDNKTGFWLQLIKKDLLVKMGDEKIEIKSERVSNVIEYLESKQIDARVIDANLSQKVLVRLRKDP